MVKNRMHGVLLKHGYQCPYSDVFGVKGRVWLSTVPLRPVYRQVLGGFLQVLEILRVQIQKASRTIDEQAKAMPFVQKLCTLPGVGHYTALLILAEIGDVSRFPNPKHLVSYAGLAPIVRASGGRVYTGHISKQGSTWLRWILIEAAQHAMRRPGRYQEVYRRLLGRKGPRWPAWRLPAEMLTTVYWMLRHAS